MDRREFVQKSLLAGIGVIGLSAAGCGGDSASAPQVYNTSSSSSSSSNDTSAPHPEQASMVIAKGKQPLEMLRQGLNKMGGIERFVKKEQLVAIKPNFSVPRKPGSGCITSPELVAELVTQCLTAGAREVRVIDYPFTNVSMCLSESGIQPAVENAGGKLFVLNQKNDRNYYQVTLPGPVLKSVFYSRDVLDADVFINFPILKHHGSTEITLGLKNLMGLVWDRGVFHSSDLEMGIAELGAFKKPHLNIMDAVKGIIDSGPSGPGTIREYNQIVLGTDIVGVDAYSAELFGLRPDRVGYIVNAASLGAGSIDWKSLNPVEITV